MKNANKGMDMKQTLVIATPQNVRATDADNLKYMVRDSIFRTEVARNPPCTGREFIVKHTRPNYRLCHGLYQPRAVSR